MLFSIDEDAGSHIVGWIMPDNPNTAPTVKVTIGSTTTLVMADVYRPLLKEQGLHNTGICGFVITERSVPGLIEATELAVHDADSGLQLYCRRRPPLIAQKLIVIETSVWPAVSIHQQLSAQFQMSYEATERYNEETTRALLGISFSNSIYIAGRIYARQFDYLYRDRGFKSAILLRDPFEELAERLLILKMIQDRKDLAVTDQLGRDVMAAASKLPSIDPPTSESLSKALTRMEDDLRNLLFNPLTRQLSTRYPEDRLDPAAVAMSLDGLSYFNAVGLRTDVPGFIESIYAAVEYEGPIDVPFLAAPNSVASFAERLKNVSAAVELVRLDYEIYAAVSEARAKVFPNSTKRHVR